MPLYSHLSGLIRGLARRTVGAKLSDKTRRRPMMKGAFLMALLTLALAGCTPRVDLLSTPNESEANDVLSVLLNNGVDAQKSTLKGEISISVDGPQAGRALDLLRSRGLPRSNFQGMGDVFKKDGLISSPLEERARYTFALSQELEGTLSDLDGVLLARVHVVLPEAAGVDKAAVPSSVGVLIKYRPGYDLELLKPKIEALVAHAIPAVKPDAVYVALVAEQSSADARGLSDAASAGSDATAGLDGSNATALAHDSDAARAAAHRSKLRLLATALAAIGLMILGGVAWRRRGARGAKNLVGRPRAWFDALTQALVRRRARAQATEEGGS